MRVMHASGACAPPSATVITAADFKPVKQLQRWIRGLFEERDGPTGRSRSGAWRVVMAVIAIVAAGVGLVLGTLTPSTAALAQSPAPARVAPSVAFHYGARPPV